MGFLLKEALKTLCSRNHWSYAVFWKIGCNNSKLSIWEDCYYEPLQSSFPASLPYRDGEGCWFSSESPPRIQEEDRVCLLINKIMVNNSVNIAGQGILGRAAFTGNHQWILLNNFTNNAYPPEINNAGSNAYSYKPLAEASDEDLIEVVTTNTLGLMICCRERAEEAEKDCCCHQRGREEEERRSKSRSCSSSASQVRSQERSRKG